MYVAVSGTGAPLAERRTKVRYVPPAFTSVSNFASFAGTYVGCIRGRLDIGVVEILDTGNSQMVF